MGRFGVNDADNYGGGNLNSFFSLKNDGDTAKVRFMYNGAEDVTGFAVHEVDIDGKHRYVNCLRSYNEPKSNCPFCAAGNVQKAKLYIPVYDMEDEEVKIWDRGKNFFTKISSLCARYAKSDVPLVAHIFEIERHGKKGDSNTTYETYEIESDDTRLEDLPDIPEVLGTIILDKTAEEMEYFLDNDCFPNSASDAGRRDSGREDSARNDERPTGRRTPSNRRGDGF